MFLPGIVVPIIFPREGLSEETMQVILEILFVVLVFSCLIWWFKLSNDVVEIIQCKGHYDD